MSKQKALMLLLALSLAGGMPCGADQLPIEIKARPASAGDERQVRIDVELTNATNEAVCVFQTFSPAAKAVANWIVTGPDGRKIPYRGPVAKVKYRNIVHRLEPGGSVSGSVDLSGGDAGSPYFDFGQPGAYGIQLIWTMSEEWGQPAYQDLFPACRPWSGTSRSNPISIMIPLP